MATTTINEQTLKSSTLFKNIPDAQISAIASQCNVKYLNPGETLFLEKDDSKSLFVVAKGTINIRKGTTGGDEDVTKIGTSQHFGEMALLMKEGSSYEKRSAGAECGGEATTVLEVPFEALTHYFETHPQFGLQFYQNLAVSLAGRIRRTTEDLAGVRALRLRHT